MKRRNNTARCRVEVWTGRMTQWRFVREYASRPNAKRAILALKEKLGAHELRWMDSTSVKNQAREPSVPNTTTAP